MELDSLKKRDVIVSKYGKDEFTMIIKFNNVEKQYIVFTSPDWMKKETVRRDYEDLEKNGWVSSKRYSWIKWLLKF